MLVNVGGHLYEMPKKKTKGLLDIGKNSIKAGIYAVEKENYLELRKDVISDKEKLKKEVTRYNQQGFKVYYK